MSIPIETLERACRKSGWRRGVPIELCDGSVWWLPILEVKHAPKMPKLRDHVRSVADGTSALYTTDDTLRHLAGIVGECLLLHYRIPAASLKRLLTPPDRAASDRLEAAVATILRWARDGRLIREFLLPENAR